MIPIVRLHLPGTPLCDAFQRVTTIHLCGLRSLQIKAGGRTEVEETEEQHRARLEMVSTQVAARGITESRLLAVLRAIPRHIFVPEGWQHQAYLDTPLPIGEGQTISQPYIVALMTSLLRLKPTDRVLEIGTGSGYQAAILGMLAEKVISIERIAAVATRAEEHLRQIGVINVEVLVLDGTGGYPPGAPYDAILVTAGTPAIPPPLLAELADHGRLVAPVGGQNVQELVLIRREGDRYEEYPEGAVRFVPLIGEHGW